MTGWAIDVSDPVGRDWGGMGKDGRAAAAAQEAQDVTPAAPSKRLFTAFSIVDGTAVIVNIEILGLGTGR